MLSDAQRLQMLQVPTGPIDLVIDSDTYNEIDDQFAIAYAHLCPEKLRVQAVYAAPFLNHRSTSPANGMENSYQEIQRLMALLRETTPSFRGSPDYLADEHTPVISPAAEDLARRAMAYTPENPLYVATLGAMTNVASALLLNPAMADRIVIVCLGGHALDWPDNLEFNMKQDVAAARVIFQSGAPLVILPCFGVVNVFSTTGPELDHWLRGKNSLCDFLVQNTVDEVNSYAAGKVWSRVLWDVTAIAWLMNDGERFMRTRLIPTPIPEYDHHYASNPCAPLCRYVFHINRDALMEDLFKRLAAK